MLLIQIYLQSAAFAYIDIPAGCDGITTRSYGAGLVNLHRDVFDGAASCYIHHTTFCAG